MYEIMNFISETWDGMSMCHKNSNRENRSEFTEKRVQAEKISSFSGDKRTNS